jgi:hypothetical protein
VQHNHIDGPLATEFVLRCLRQRLLTSSVYAKLKSRLRELPAEERMKGNAVEVEDPWRDALEQVRREIKQAERNLAFATSQENFQAIEGIIGELRAREQSLAAEQMASKARIRSTLDEEAEVEAAIQVLDRLAELAADGRGLCDGQGSLRSGEREAVSKISASPQEAANRDQDRGWRRDAWSGATARDPVRRAY